MNGVEQEDHVRHSAGRDKRDCVGSFCTRMASPSPTWSARSYDYKVSPDGDAPERLPPPAPVTDPRSYQEQLFEFHAPTLPIEDDSSSAVPSFPLQLVDRHIPHSLILKHVKILPSLPNDISDALDNYSVQLDALPDAAFVFQQLKHRDMREVNARTIATLRRTGICLPGQCIASSLILRPTQPNGQTVQRLTVQLAV
ncbi:hypothetical protein BDZ89DRAFT_1114157 [Hymenopellis radicata]|nr:hypothetical protein BDZ89DRAFT_1114157 [Hymenopellis radicata]